MRRSLSLAVRLLGVFAGAAAIGLSMATPAEAIANGEPVAPGAYRFAVKLTMTNIPRPDGSHYDSACSAALVSYRWIITAGHCFHDPFRNPVSGLVPYPTTATIGRVDVNGTGGVVAKVVWVQQSPSTDIALAELDRPVTGIAPIAVATSAPKVGQVVRLTGWGATDPANPAPSTRLYTGQMTVSSVAEHTVGVRGYRPTPTTSACLWDSGAPYFVERPHRPPVLVGVESDGPDCPHDQEETAARVDNIVTWIHRIAGH
jgi:secreted trypsin-like serine protease